MPNIVRSTDTRYLLMDANTTADAASDFLARQEYAQSHVHIINPGGETVVINVGSDTANLVDFQTTTAVKAFIALPPYCPFVQVVRGAGVTAVTAIVTSAGRERS